MSIRVEAILEITNPVDALSTRVQVEELFERRRGELSQAFNADLSEWKEALSVFPQTTRFTLRGPFGFRMDTLKSGLALVHCGWIHWNHFVSNTRGMRTLFLEILTKLASYCGGHTIICVPDSAYPPSGAVALVDEGAGIPEIVEWLRDNFGPPMESTESHSEHLNPNPPLRVDECYFIKRLDCDVTFR